MPTPRWCAGGTRRAGSKPVGQVWSRTRSPLRGAGRPPVDVRSQRIEIQLRDLLIAEWCRVDVVVEEMLVTTEGSERAVAVDRRHAVRQMAQLLEAVIDEPELPVRRTVDIVRFVDDTTL